MARTVDTICSACGNQTKTWKYILKLHGHARCTDCVKNKYVGRCFACGILILSLIHI